MPRLEGSALIQCFGSIRLDSNGFGLILIRSILLDLLQSFRLDSLGFDAFPSFGFDSTGVGRFDSTRFDCASVRFFSIRGDSNRFFCFHLIR